MSLTRRAALGLTAAGLAGGLSGCGLGRNAAVRPGAVPVTITAHPVPRFLPGSDERRFGDLTFLGGFELSADHDEFGGFSGLWRSPDGGEIVAVTDAAHWLTASLDLKDGRIAGFRGAAMAPILGPSGAPLRGTRSYDTESLTIAGGVAYVGIERSHDVLAFPFGRDGVRALGRSLGLPRDVAGSWPRNKGAEGVAVMPPGSASPGALVVVSERARWGRDAPSQGLIGEAGRWQAFDIVRTGNFEITDIAFLPSGDALLLERRYSVLRGAACRIRRIAAGAIRPGAQIDGPVIFMADASAQIDNLEGLAIHRDGAGRTILTLISDDNFSILQRTLLLEFALEPQAA